jgi:hypothetical protein
MAYTPTTWKDHLVPYPGRYIATPNADGTYTLIEDFGTPTQEGTPISAANMNKIEQGIADAHSSVDSHAAATTGVHGATSAATANRIVQRDANGRINIADPTSASHATTKNYVDTVANSKFDKAGGTITGNVIIDNAQLQFRDGTATKKVIHTWGGDSNGIGVAFGGGGATVVYGGEADTKIIPNVSPTGENVYVGADSHVYLYSNLQSSWEDRKEAIWRNDGVLMLDGKRAMTRGDDPTGLIIPLLMPEVYYYTTNDSVDNTSVQNAEDTPLNLEDYKLLVNTDHFRGRSVYFEAIMSVASSGGLAVCRLVKPGQSGPQHIVEITTSSLMPTRVRSAVATLQNGDQLFIKFYSKFDNWQARLYAARLVIL